MLGVKFITEAKRLITVGNSGRHKHKSKVCVLVSVSSKGVRITDQIFSQTEMEKRQEEKISTLCFVVPL